MPVVLALSNCFEVSTTITTGCWRCVTTSKRLPRHGPRCLPRLANPPRSVSKLPQHCQPSANALNQGRRNTLTFSAGTLRSCCVFAAFANNVYKPISTIPRIPLHRIAVASETKKLNVATFDKQRLNPPFNTTFIIQRFFKIVTVTVR